MPSRICAHVSQFVPAPQDVRCRRIDARLLYAESSIDMAVAVAASAERLLLDEMG